MRQSFAIAWLHTKMTLKSKGSLFSMVVMPLLLTLVFGFLTAGGGGSNSKGAVFPISVTDQDNSFLSQQFISMLQAEENLKITVVPESEIVKLFSDKKILSALIIPGGFQNDVAGGATPEVKLQTAPDGNSYEGVTPIIRWQLPRLAQDYQLALRSTGGQDAAKVQEAYKQIAAQRKDVASTVESKTVAAKVVETATNAETAGTHASIGFTISFVMMLVFMMSGVILGERQAGTWGRLLTTPNSRATVMTGYLLSFFLTGMIQFTILVAATKLFFHIDWGPLLPLTIMAAATVLCASGMGLFLAGLVKTKEQQSSIGILFVNATSMLGGVYWDLGMTSKTMQKIAYLTPQAWAIDGFNEVMYHGARLSVMALPLVVLLGITAVFMTAGLLRVRYE